MGFDTTALGVCQASCPWRGGPPQLCQMLECCPRRCVGCERGWPYDGEYRHIGPVKAPHSNRWECNRVKWLGVRGSQPCVPGGVVVEWINAGLVGVLWEDVVGSLVSWVTEVSVRLAAAA
jgi:hypothetical protein